jgi:hypothetical protein
MNFVNSSLINLREDVTEKCLLPAQLPQSLGQNPEDERAIVFDLFLLVKILSLV